MILFLKKYALDNYLLLLRIWFGSLLIYHGFSMSEKDTVYIVCHWILNSVLSPQITFYLAAVIEWVCAVSLIAGLFSRFYCGVIGFFMLFAMVLFFIFHTINLDGGSLALTRYFFWFSILFIFFGPGIWSVDRFMADRSTS